MLWAGPPEPCLCGVPSPRGPDNIQPWAQSGVAPSCDICLSVTLMRICVCSGLDHWSRHEHPCRFRSQAVPLAALRAPRGQIVRGPQSATGTQRPLCRGCPSDFCVPTFLGLRNSPLDGPERSAVRKCPSIQNSGSRAGELRDGRGNTCSQPAAHSCFLLRLPSLR